MKYMICYDVPDDKCRRKIVNYLEAIGRRIQYSVFIGEIPMRKIETIKKKLWELADTGDDSCIVIAPICQNCQEKVLQYGKSKEEEVDYVIV